MNKRSIPNLLADLIFSVLMVLFIYNLRFKFSIPISHTLTIKLLLFSPLIFILINSLFGIYSENSSINLDIMGSLFLSGIITYALYFFIFLIIKIYIKNLEFATPVLILFAFIIPFFTVLIHIFFENLFYRNREKENLLIIGYRDRDKKTFEKYLKYIKNKYTVIGIIGDPYKKNNTFSKERDIFSILEQYNVKVILFSNSVDDSSIERIVFSTSIFSQKLLFFPELYEKFSEWGKPLSIGEMPLFELDIKPIKGINYFLQRFFDIIFSLIAMFLFLPFGIIFAILIIADSHGSIFFKQIRIGRHGKPFKLLKFRTMVKNAEKLSGPKWAEKNDKRITRIGKFLRRTSIDEIPQLFNVLIGKMSMVGPRPERPYFIEKHSVLKGIRMLVKPGITGLAQINGRYELTPEEKFGYDLHFINHFSIFTYFLILIKTLIIIILGKGVR